jgi:hypothetical protein
MKNILRFSLILFAAVVTSCHKDLDRFPPNSFTSTEVYATEEGYTQVLAKIYGSMALTGNSGPAGAGDVAGIDEGTSDFLRLFWKAQELPTDEAVVTWNDPGIQDFHNMNWASTNPMLNGLYNRCFYIITLANEFLRESTPEKLSSRSLGSAAENIKTMRAEVRFVRAFQYWVLMDLFANPGFVNESVLPGTKEAPNQITRANLFRFVEAELKAIEPDLSNARTAAYGRADKAASWALLARIYLNAEVYTGTARWADAISHAQRVITAGYSLMPVYGHNFLADNNVNNTEFIWTLNYDGVSTRNFGGTTFLVNGSVNGESAAQKDLQGLSGWSGLRTTKNLPQLFPGYPGFASTPDARALFFTQGQNAEIADISKFTDGYAVAKYRNRTRTGGYGKDPNRTFADIDFPVFRLAEMYLIYAEATLRGGTGGTTAQATTYINNLRQRAYGNNNGNVSGLTVNDILDERGRELYWEAFRRTDLVRYNRFTTATYLWPWKGGVSTGTSVPAFRNIYPIPTSEVSANPNIVQNPNY